MPRRRDSVEGTAQRWVEDYETSPAGGCDKDPRLVCVHTVAKLIRAERRRAVRLVREAARDARELSSTEPMPDEIVDSIVAAILATPAKGGRSA